MEKNKILTEELLLLNVAKKYKEIVASILGIVAVLLFIVCGSMAISEDGNYSEGTILVLTFGIFFLLLNLIFAFTKITGKIRFFQNLYLRRLLKLNGLIIENLRLVIFSHRHVNSLYNFSKHKSSFSEDDYEKIHEYGDPIKNRVTDLDYNEYVECISDIITLLNSIEKSCYYLPSDLLEIKDDIKYYKNLLREMTSEKIAEDRGKEPDMDYFMFIGEISFLLKRLLSIRDRFISNFKERELLSGEIRQYLKS